MCMCRACVSLLLGLLFGLFWGGVCFGLFWFCLLFVCFALFFVFHNSQLLLYSSIIEFPEFGLVLVLDLKHLLLKLPFCFLFWGISLRQREAITKLNSLCRCKSMKKFVFLLYQCLSQFSAVEVPVCWLSSLAR